MNFMLISLLSCISGCISIMDSFNIKGDNFITTILRSKGDKLELILYDDLDYTMYKTTYNVDQVTTLIKYLSSHLYKVESHKRWDNDI